MVLPAGELIGACDQLEVEQRRIVGKGSIEQKNCPTITILGTREDALEV